MMGTFDTEIVIYQSEDGHTKVDVRFEDETDRLGGSKSLTRLQRWGWS